MNVDIYTGIKNKLVEITDLKTVALFNNQFERSNNNSPEQNDEQAFLYPCAFIEFSDILYTDMQKWAQQFTATLRIHLGFESYKNEDLDVLTLKQSIYQKLQGFQPSDSTGMLMRRSEEPNYDHNNIQVYIITFAFSGKDWDVLRGYPTQTATATPEINATLDIDNQVIRTGDGA